MAVENYLALANAIIVQAVNDYRRALVKRALNPESRSAEYEVKSIERFFYSEYYMMLTDLDPRYLISRIREEVEEDANAYKLDLFE